MNSTKLALGVFGILAIAIGATLWLRSATGLGEIDEMMSRGEYEAATEALEKYTADHPDDYLALQMLTSAMFKTKKYQNLEGAQQVDELLDKIPDTAENASAAREQQAELALMVLHRPQRAEALLKRALKLNANSSRANSMMWTVYQVTRRFPLAEPYYNRTYESAPAEMRIGVLRDWYLSQFNPLALNSAYDQTMGIKPGPQAELQRYDQFVKNEPEAPAPRAAGASHLIELSMFQEAIDTMTAPEVDRSEQDEFFVSTLIDGYLGLEKFEEAKQELAGWAFGETYAFHRAAAMVSEVVDKDYDKAIVHYEAGMKLWPGAIDMKTRQRYIACLRLAGQDEKATAAEEKMHKDNALLDPELHAALREAIKNLHDPDATELFAGFYSALGREVDARRWDQMMPSGPGAPGMAKPPIAAPGTAPADSGF